MEKSIRSVKTNPRKGTNSLSNFSNEKLFFFIFKVLISDVHQDLLNVGDLFSGCPGGDFGFVADVELQGILFFFEKCEDDIPLLWSELDAFYFDRHDIGFKRV